VPEAIQRASKSDYAAAVAVSPDGNTVYVTGRSPGTDSGFDYATVAYDAATGRPFSLAPQLGEDESDEDRALAWPWRPSAG
jgi:DNA-binding beta-propeller fold protein YncE